MKQRHKSSFKTNRAASVLNRGIGKAIRGEEGDTPVKGRLTKEGLKVGEAVSNRYRRNGEDVTVVSVKQKDKTYGAFDI